MYTRRLFKMMARSVWAGLKAFAVILIAMHAYGENKTTLLEHATPKDTPNRITRTSFSFTPQFKLLKDTHNEFQLEDIEPLTNTLPWRSDTRPNFGFSHASYWIKSEITNAVYTKLNFTLEIGYPLLDSVNVTVIDRASKEIINTFIVGDRLPYNQRVIQHPSFLFPLALEPSQTVDIYIKIRSTSSVQIPLKIWSDDGLLKKIKNNAIYASAFFGAILVMALYNLFLSFSLRRQSYFYFAMTLATYSLVEGDLTGYNYEILWPNSPAWNSISLTVISSMTLAMFTLFSRSFLQLKTLAPKLDKVVVLVANANVALAIISMFMPYSVMIKVVAVSVFTTPLISFVIGIHLTNKGRVDARYFVLAFSTLIAFSTIFVMGKFGLIEDNFFIANVIHFGALISIILLSFALADQINIEIKRREIAQAESIVNLNQYRYIYEHALEGLFQANGKGDLLSHNKAFKKIIDMNREGDSFNFLNFFINTDKNTSIWQIIWQRQITQGLEVQCKKPNGEIFWASIDTQKMSDKYGHTILDGSIVDITEKKESEKRLAHLASHDSLTNLYNRYEFEKHVNQSIAIAQEHKQQHVILYIDLDQFKIVNDTCGHNAGDELLKQIAQLLRTNISSGDVLARVGGDEFSLVLSGCKIVDAKVVAHRILHSLEEYRFSHSGKFFTVSASIGAVLIDENTESYQEVISLADTACYAAKEGGRNKVVVHNKGDIVSDRLNEMQLVSSLKESLDSNNFVLYKQDIKALQNEDASLHYEILLKMKVDDKLLDPGYFIPAMERFQKMKVVDFWVIETYFRWLSQHPEHVKELGLGCINVSAQTLGDNSFEEFLLSKFEQYSISPEKICFEIVESSAIINLTTTQQFLAKMRTHGVKFSLDDFGTGFSSYSYLKSLNVDYLKIDGSFIRDILRDDVDMVMVRSMADIAHSMGLKVVAEFVETKEISQRVAQLGIDYGQGYYFDKPKPLE